MVKQQKKVVVYSSPTCGQCRMTVRVLEAQGTLYDEIDVTEDLEANAYVKELGYLTAPVVVVDGGADHWYGFRPDKLAGL